MATLTRRRWESDLGSGLSTRDRRSCEYDAYVPDPLVGRPATLDRDVAADVAEAERAIAALNTEVRALANTEALARLLLRAEAVASSKIEGLEVGGRRLLRAQAARELGERSPDITAVEVLGNIDAMAWAIGSIKEGDPITLDMLLEIHRRLLAGSRLAVETGAIRTTQNWIGGSDYNPCSAAFVPSPPELVPDLVDDLCAFCNEDMLPAVAQAAVAHAQFETIHPFADGNGRTGRALIHLVLRRRGLETHVIPPISLLLATWTRGYVDGLKATRYLGVPGSREARDGCNRWIALFAVACRRAVDDAKTFEARTFEIESSWRADLGRVRAGSSVDLLLRALPGTPIITVNGAAQLLGRSFEASNNAIRRLVEVGILRQVKVGRRNRAFEAPDIIEAFTLLERRLASPEADTRVAPPAQAVPLAQMGAPSQPSRATP